MSALKSKIQSAIRSGKFNIFLLFVVISFVILLLSKLSKDYTKTVTFDIKAINLPEEQVIIKDSTHKIDVLLKTYGFKLMRYYLSNPRLAVNLDNTQNVDGIYIWTSALNAGDIRAQFSDNVEVQSIMPDTIVFDYDVNYVKKVPVVLLSKINYAPGYNVKDGYLLEPDSVRLIGPRAVVDIITEVLTDTLILSDVKTNIDQKLNLKLPEQIETIAMSSKKVVIKGNVDKFTEGTVQVPVSIKNLPRGVSVNYFPKKVSVIFNTALSNYKSVKANDFSVECDYKNLTSQSSFLVPKLVKKPSIVTTAKINQSKIEFILSQ